MTLGEKIKFARQNAGLSQKQPAERVFVSRAAIAKWESGAGLPDILNLKALADLFSVTIDDLVDENRKMELFQLKESICPDQFQPSGRCRNQYDAAVAGKFPDAYWIVPVRLLHGLNKGERIVSFLTFGLLELFWQISHRNAFDSHYYLVEMGDRQYLVQLDDTTIITTALPIRIHFADEFYAGGRKYQRLGYDLLKE